MAVYEDLPEGEIGVDDAPTSGALSSFINVVAAAVSLSLLAGVGVWGYKLMMRDVSGIPVVRAVEGPMRSQPKDPGGRPADHQGLAVNEVAAQGAATDPADRLVLAPKPVVLYDEDLPKRVVSETPPPQAESQAPTAAASSAAKEPGSEAAESGSLEALIAGLTDGVEPLEPLAPETPVAQQVEPETLQPDPEPEPEIVVAVVEGPGPKSSVRPVVRPASFAVPTAQGIAPIAQDGTDPAASLDVDPASLAAGTKLAQLGAYESADVARSEWDRIAGKFSDYMDGKQRVIQRASSGGRVFYRLRVMGFSDLSDARRFCSALVAENADCIPVTTR